MTRTGRRPGAPDTREAILVAARRGFATRGYDATSVRAIATEADVDPALVIHYFGTKEALFTAATGLPPVLPAIIAGLAAMPPQDFGKALVSSYVSFVDSDDSRNAILALVRSAVSHEEAADTLRQFLTVQLLPVIIQFTRHPDAQLRATLIAAQLVGIAMLRHVLHVESLAKATPDDIATLVAPAIEQYLR